LDYFKTARELLRIPYAEIPEEEVYRDGCFQVKWDASGRAFMEGFGGKSYDLVVSTLPDGGGRWEADYTSMSLLILLYLRVYMNEQPKCDIIGKIVPVLECASEGNSRNIWNSAFCALKLLKN
jgi:hypothetical protein